MASGKPGPLHFSLVIFVMTSLMLTVATYYLFKNLGDAELKLVAETKKVEVETKNSKNYLNDLNALREAAGYRSRGGLDLGAKLPADARKRLDDLPVRGPGGPDDESVIGEIKRDITSAFGSKDNATLRSTLLRLKSEKDSLKVEFDKTKKLAQTQEELLAALNKEYKVHVFALVHIPKSPSSPS